jgi:hypothetical protein
MVERKLDSGADAKSARVIAIFQLSSVTVRAASYLGQYRSSFGALVKNITMDQ